MKLLNSSTNQKVELSDNEITIYNCGPTVYNYVHIGNVRPLVIFDVLFRYLLAIGKRVLYIQNITDVDDKIINAAIQAKLPEEILTSRYIKAYLYICELLNIEHMTMPKVSDNIKDIQQYIENLIKKDAAYVVDGDVYFDVGKIKNYGHVSHQNIDELLEGVRKENKANKKSPLDFVLWKKTDKGISWDSPWSKGRPGWHTECCVLIDKYIGDHVTIHGGGVDLKFPHHENENAQNIATHGKDIANIWMHVGHINVNGSKMSKSLNNFILVNDIITPDNANGLRWFFYQAKYQQPVNFSQELFDSTTKEINNLVKTLTIVKTHLIANDQFKLNHKPLKKEFDDCLADDLNLPNAITVVLTQMKDLNTFIRDKDFAKANECWSTIANELDVLGIRYDQAPHEQNIDAIKKWKQSVDAKDYDQSDKIRQELIKKGLL